MKLHILGICGTFMGGVAALAKQLGYEVSGMDSNVYPPMSTQLEKLNIQLIHGYDKPIPACDQVIIGNALSRGNPAVEAILNQKIAYTSGPAWLRDQVLNNKTVIAVAGTHGKTTTASMLAWIFEYAGKKPGFLIGGVAANFTESACLGDGDCFVVEADEYDSAFFDKRSKFVHYRPKIAVINNIEFDHADIFEDLNAIKKQFHYFVRTIPGNGKLIINQDDIEIPSVLEQGCWTPVVQFGLQDEAEWQATATKKDWSEFTVYFNGNPCGEVDWQLIGQHNAYNALAAIAAAYEIDVDPETAIAALAKFKGVKRRLQLQKVINNIHIYDDFAHHPTAIKTTLQAMRSYVGNDRILLALDPRSNTMRMGHHKETLAASLADADKVFLLKQDLDWYQPDYFEQLGNKFYAYDSVDDLVVSIKSEAKLEDHIIFMSNGSFGGAKEKFVKLLEGKV